MTLAIPASTARPARQPFHPPLFTPALAVTLAAEGYVLPESWPYPARPVTDRTAAAGWKLRQPGSLTQDGQPEYIGPDGVVYVKVARGAAPVLVSLSKRTGPILLRLKPGQRRPAWLIEQVRDTPKREAPVALKPFLFRKKGEQPEPQPPADPRIADVDRRIQAQKDRGERVSAGLLALRTRIIRGVAPVAKSPTVMRSGLAGYGEYPTDTELQRRFQAGAVPGDPLTELEIRFQSFDRARRALLTAEEEKVERSIPARRAVLTRAIEAMRSAFVAAHPELDGNGLPGAFASYVQDRVGCVVDLEPRRSLPGRRSAGPRAPRAGRVARAPILTSRAAILASGLVTIVKTPKQLDRSQGWWTEDGKRPEPVPSWKRPHDPEQQRAYREGISTGAPKWLRRPRTAREIAAAGFRTAEQERRKAAVYIGGHTFTPPSQMSDRQRQHALASIGRRLSGETDLDFALASEEAMAA